MIMICCSLMPGSARCGVDEWARKKADRASSSATTKVLSATKGNKNTWKANRRISFIAISTSLCGMLHIDKGRAFEPIWQMYGHKNKPMTSKYEWSGLEHIFSPFVYVECSTRYIVAMAKLRKEIGAAKEKVENFEVRGEKKPRSVV